MDKKLRETTYLCVEIMNSKRQVKGKLSHVYATTQKQNNHFLIFPKAINIRIGHEAVVYHYTQNNEANKKYP